MNTQFEIRKAEIRDLSSLTRLLQMLFNIEADFTPEPEKQQRGLALLLADDRRGRVIVAEVDGKIVGMCSAQLVVSTAEGALSGWIEDLILDENYRGCGIGSHLLKVMEDWCFAQGASRVQLLCDRANIPALRFYAGMGWEKTQLIGMRKFKD